MPVARGNGDLDGSSVECGAIRFYHVIEKPVEMPPSGGLRVAHGSMAGLESDDRVRIFRRSALSEICKECCPDQGERCR